MILQNHFPRSRQIPAVDEDDVAGRGVFSEKRKKKNGRKLRAHFLSHSSSSSTRGKLLHKERGSFQSGRSPLIPSGYAEKKGVGGGYEGGTFYGTSHATNRRRWRYAIRGVGQRAWLHGDQSQTRTMTFNFMKRFHGYYCGEMGRNSGGVLDENYVYEFQRFKFENICWQKKTRKYHRFTRLTTFLKNKNVAYIKYTNIIYYLIFLKSKKPLRPLLQSFSINRWWF